MQYSYLNGEFIPENQARISIQDRGLLLADGLFTTLRCYQGKPFALKAHWQRLNNGASLLRIPFLVSFEQLQSDCQKLLRLNALLDCDSSLRITLTRGPGPRGLNLPTHLTPSFIIQNNALATLVHAPAQLIANEVYPVPVTPLSAFKTLSYTDRIMAREHAISQGYTDVLLLNSAREIVSTSAANIFMVINQKLYTPQLTSGIVKGIMREFILQLAEQTSSLISVHCTSLRLSDLRMADEVFLTNSLIEIQPVSRFEHTYFATGKQAFITNLLKAAFQRHKTQEIS